MRYEEYRREMLEDNCDDLPPVILPKKDEEDEEEDEVARRMRGAESVEEW